MWECIDESCGNCLACKNKSLQAENDKLKAKYILSSLHDEPEGASHAHTDAVHCADDNKCVSLQIACRELKKEIKGLCRTYCSKANQCFDGRKIECTVLKALANAGAVLGKKG